MIAKKFPSPSEITRENGSKGKYDFSGAWRMEGNRALVRSTHVPLFMLSSASLSSSLLLLQKSLGVQKGLQK